MENEARDQGSISVGQTGSALIAPNLSSQSCGNCKFQRQHPKFGPLKLCLRFPPQVHVLADVTALLQPGEVVTDGRGAPVARLDGGGMRVVTVRNELRLPPADDDMWCGEWKARFLGSNGERIS